MSAAAWETPQGAELGIMLVVLGVIGYAVYKVFGIGKAVAQASSEQQATIATAQASGTSVYGAAPGAFGTGSGPTTKAVHPPDQLGYITLTQQSDGTWTDSQGTTRDPTTGAIVTAQDMTDPGATGGW